MTNADSAVCSSPRRRATRASRMSAATPRPGRRSYLAAASGKSFEALRQAHIAEHQRLFRRVQLDLGSTDAMKLPTDERIKDFGERQRPAVRGALLPVWPLPADILLATRGPAGQLAGTLGRQHEPAVGRQIHDQHQHRDELLAGGDVQSRRVRGAAAAHGAGPHRDRRAHREDALGRGRVGRAPQHRPLARVGAH